MSKSLYASHPEYVYRVRSVERITDGDTYWLYVDTGFRNTLLVHGRLNGYDTPERYRGSDFEKAEAKRAQEFVVVWFAERLNDSRVFLQSEKDPDNFGRWLVKVWAERDYLHSVVLGNALINEDLASLWPVRWKEVYDNGSA